MTCAIRLPSPILVSHTDFYKLFPLPNFLEVSYPLQKRGWDLEEVENYVYSSKNLHNNI